jgi:hypothetical protein
MGADEERCRDQSWARVRLKYSCWYGLAVAGRRGSASCRQMGCLLRLLDDPM